MGKRIVICADGTWNTPDQTDRGKTCPSNVAKIALSLATQGEDGTRQVVYYDRGLGTEWYDHLRGGISGVGISTNIKDAYRFIVEIFEEGDELFFFGFSRGAYTVRSTVGLIRNSGLLKRENLCKIDDAYKLYRRRDDASHPSRYEAELFRRTYAREVRVKFIGVWDTVGALGIPVQNVNVLNRLLNVQFHDVTLTSWVDNAFQALAIDEPREAFRPSIWEQQEDSAGQRLEQAWFAGAHCNVGGGYADAGLSDIAFEWMREKAGECGLVFDECALERMKIEPNWQGAIRNPKKGMYKLFPDYLRPIGRATQGNESVHPLALKRLAQSQDYRPENLRQYLERTPAVASPA